MRLFERSSSSAVTPLSSSSSTSASIALSTRSSELPAAAGSSLERVESAIDAEVELLLDKGVTAEELERSKSRMIADYIYAQDNQSKLARQCGTAQTTG